MRCLCRGTGSSGPLSEGCRKRPRIRLHVAYQLAIGYTFIGEREQAIRHLIKSAADREGQIHYLRLDPVFDAIRTDSRYIELEKTVEPDRE